MQRILIESPSPTDVSNRDVAASRALNRMPERTA